MFSPIIEHDKYHGTLYKGPQDNLASIVQMIRSYFAKKEVDRNKRLKKKPFSQWQKFWPIFRSILECNRPQGTKYKGPQSILTIAVKFIRAFF